MCNAAAVYFCASNQEASRNVMNTGMDMLVGLTHCLVRLVRMAAGSTSPDFPSENPGHRACCLVDGSQIERSKPAGHGVTTCKETA